MIACLAGELFSKSPDKLIVNVHGVGYEVFISQSSQSRLPEAGQPVFLHIYTSVREDALNLFGFIDEEEKEMFLLLVGVSGVGPKLALNMLSGIRPDDLARAIMAEDLHCLTKLPGVGKKTAERLCLELKDKVQFIPVHAEHAGLKSPPLEPLDQRGADVISALVNLGYQAAGAKEALESVRGRVEEEAFAAMPLEELLRQALRALA